MLAHDVLGEAGNEMILKDAFDSLAAAAQASAAEKSPAKAFVEAERLGMKKLGDNEPSAKTEYELANGSETLWFQYRWYDQSKAFSIRPDRNILTVHLFESGKPTEQATFDYED